MHDWQYIRMAGRVPSRHFFLGRSVDACMAHVAVTGNISVGGVIEIQTAITKDC